MPKLIPRTPSNRLGTVLLAVGLVPFVLYVLDYLDVIRPDADPGEFGLILMALAPIGIGSLLLASKGESIGEALLGWFRGRGGGSSPDQ